MNAHAIAKLSYRGKAYRWLCLASTLAAFVVGFGVPVYPAEVPRDVPTPSAIVAAYRRNFASLMPIAVRYEQEQIEGIGLVERDRLELIRQQALLAARPVLDQPTPPPGTVASTSTPGMTIAEVWRILRLAADEAPKQLEYLDYRLKPGNVEKRLKEPRRWRFQWWCDQQSFHVRWPKHHGVDCADIDRVQLDAGPITPESLEKNYGLVQMISRCATNKPAARFWYGTENNPRGPAGEIGNASLRAMQSTVSFPPLGLTVPEWAPSQQFTDIDQFMSQPLEAYQVVGKTVLAGRKVILMDCDLDYDTKLPMLKFKRRARAWIDPRRGFIPVRLEYDTPPAGGSKRLQFPATMGKLSAVSEVDELREIRGSFYPIRGRRQEYVPDARWEMELEKKKESPIGKVNPSMLPGWRRTWRVTKFAASAPVEPGALALAFPDGTVILNADTNP